MKKLLDGSSVTGVAMRDLLKAGRRQFGGIHGYRDLNVRPALVERGLLEHPGRLRRRRWRGRRLSPSRGRRLECRGAALVASAEVEEGMRCLDEATVRPPAGTRPGYKGCSKNLSSSRNFAGAAAISSARPATTSGSVLTSFISIRWETS